MASSTNVLPLREAEAETSIVDTLKAGSLRRAKARRRQTLMIALSALLFIGIPTILATYYYASVATDQYISEFKFSVRGPEMSNMQGGGNAVIGALVADAFVVTDFINSRQMVAEVRKKINLVDVYNRPEADFLARLGANRTQEELSQYWTRMVKAHFDMLTGIVTVSVRTFRRDDSLAVANAISEVADAMVFKMSERARGDAVRFAVEEVKRAEDVVQKKRIALRDYRVQERVIDASKSAAAESELVNKLTEELTRMKAELSTMSSYVGQAAPQIQVLKSRIRATQEQITRIGGNLEGKGGPNNTQISPAVMAEFESLTTEMQFAEKGYAAALEALQRARSNADRQTTYLTQFVAPNKPDESLYPMRFQAILTVLGIAFVAWFLGLLIISSIRDHLT